MLFPKGLAVSLPSGQLGQGAPPTSVLDLHSLEQVELDARLRSVVRLIAGFCNVLGCRIVFIHRPEIFTHGETLSWLTDKLGGVGDHLNISDGTTIKLLPGMRNHFFFYLQERPCSVKAFERFIARAPETLCQIDVQINTTFSLIYRNTLHRPQTMLLQAEHFATSKPVEFCSFYLNQHSVADSAARVVTLPVCGSEAMKAASEIVFVAFTDSSASDALFCRIVAENIVNSLRVPKNYLLVLCAPPPEVENEPFLAQVTRLFDGLRRSGVTIPRAVLNNTLIASAIPDELAQKTITGKMTIVIPDSFNAWSYPRSFWAAFCKVTVIVPRSRRRDKEAIMTLLTNIIGSPPELLWTATKEIGSIYSKVKHGYCI